VNTFTKGPAPDARYERLNPGAKARRRPLSQLPISVVKDYCREILAEEYAAGRYQERVAAEAFADVMAMTLHHGAYREGLGSIGARYGVSKSTLIRGSKHLRKPPGRARPAGEWGLLWRTRGTRETGVTVWRAGHPLILRLEKIRARRNAVHDAVLRRKHQRDEIRRLTGEQANPLPANASPSKGVTTRHVAAPGAAGSAGGSPPGGGLRPGGASCSEDPELPASRCAFCRRGIH